MTRIALFLTAAAALVAQAGFRVEGRLVLVNASVFDDHNRFRPGLRAENFRVLDDGVEVGLTSVGVEEVALSTVIVLDVSRSMKKNLDSAREALNRFLDKARLGDEFCLLAFNDAVLFDCVFVRDAGAIRARAAELAGEGGTALGDALLKAMAMVKRAKNPRRAILIFSDGLDTSSAHNWKEVRRTAEETEAVLYAVSLPLWRDWDAWQGFRLRELVEGSGGRMLTVNRAKEWPAVLEGLEVRLQYMLAFVPRAARDDKPRYPVRVQLRGEAAKHLRVYWRRSYSARVH